MTDTPKSAPPVWAKTHWTRKQREHLDRLVGKGATIAYWCSDAHGRPANHACQVGWRAKPGLVQTVEGPLEPCSEHALHATYEPHRWRGCRVWLVGLVGEIRSDGARLAALRREIVGEIMPEQALNPSVGVRIGRKDLPYADLSSANLRGADMPYANLHGADLSSANLHGADMSGANLYGANLHGADLSSANLHGANLHGADLSSANLHGADMSGANLYGANLHGADMPYANLSRAKLRCANLRCANLFSADLSRANLSSAYRYSTDPVIDGWCVEDGRLVRA